MIHGEEEKALSEAIFSAKQNVLGGPVKTPFGYYIYEVKSVTPGTQQPLVAGEVDDQTAADLHRRADRAQQVRQGIQKEVAGEDGMPLRLRGRRLQGLQSAQDQNGRRRNHLART